MSWFVATSRQRITLKKHVEDIEPRRHYLYMANKAYQCTIFSNLKDAGFEPYLPCYRKTSYKGRHPWWEPEPLFGRYIFIHFDERWPSVHEVRGICNVLKPREDQSPYLIEDQEIAAWRRKEQNGFIIMDLIGLQEGQRVRTKNEIFANQIGRFVGLSDRKHEIALFDIMGQSARVEFQQPRSLVPA